MSFGPKGPYSYQEKAGPSPWDSVTVDEKESKATQLKVHAPYFSELVRAELQRARKKFGPIHSMHEGKAVIEEELEEFWECTRNWKGDEPTQIKVNALKELVQIAAMAQRTAEDLGFIEEEKD